MALITFTPAVDAPPSFLATFDGVQYNVVVTWNLFRKGYYFSVYSTSGAQARIFTRPLVGSIQGSANPINLLVGYFLTSTLYFYPSTQQFEVLP